MVVRGCFARQDVPHWLVFGPEPHLAENQRRRSPVDCLEIPQADRSVHRMILLLSRWIVDHLRLFRYRVPYQIGPFFPNLNCHLLLGN